MAHRGGHRGEEATPPEDLRAAAKLTVDAHSTVVLQAVDGSGTRRSAARTPSVIGAQLFSYSAC